jgi:hypothetical protein
MRTGELYTSRDTSCCITLSSQLQKAVSTALPDVSTKLKKWHQLVGNSQQ